MRRIGELRSRIEQWQDLDRSLTDLAELIDLADESLEEDFRSELRRLAALTDEMELAATLSGPHDQSNAILVVHSGEGGIDAQDWAEMLLRMYVKWAGQAGYKSEVLDTTEGEEAGIKNGTLEITRTERLRLRQGRSRVASTGAAVSVRFSSSPAYIVRTRRGITRDRERHRDRPESGRCPRRYLSSQRRRRPARQQDLVSSPPHARANRNRRHVPERAQPDPEPRDGLENSAGTTPRAEDERRGEERSRLKGEHTAAGFGNRIRSYVLHPYTMVTDHRTEVSVGNTQAVLNGEIGYSLMPISKAKWVSLSLILLAKLPDPPVLDRDRVGTIRYVGYRRVVDGDIELSERHDIRALGVG